MKNMKELYEMGYALVEDCGYDEAVYSIEDGDDWDSINHWNEMDEDVEKIEINHEKREIRVYLED